MWEGSSPKSGDDYMGDACEADPNSPSEAETYTNRAGAPNFLPNIPTGSGIFSLCDELFLNHGPLMDVSCEDVRRPGVDSYAMDSGGALFLHEITHWWGMMNHIGDVWTQTVGYRGTEDYQRRE